MSSRFTGDRPIGAALEEMLKKFHLDTKMRQVKLINAWAELMGPAVAHRTTELKIVDGKLFVQLSSASLRQELFQDRLKIMELLNQAAGAVVIQDIIFQ